MLTLKFKPLPVGSILQPAENPFAPPNDPNNQNDVMLYQQWEARQDAFNRNNLAAEDYLNHFNQDFLVNYEAGRAIGPRGIGDPDAVPPYPPLSELVMVIRSEDGSIGYDFPKIGPPVCAVPHYAKIPAPQVWSR